MTTNAHGSAKEVAYKKEVTWAVPPGQSGAQLLRRVTHVPNLKKSAAESEEITSHRQRTGVRHGVKTVEIAHAGKLSAGTYKDFVAAAVRKAYAAVADLTGLSITISGSGPTYTVNRASGSWLTGGIKFGQVGRLTAGAFNAANLNKNLAVLAVTASDLTVLVVNDDDEVGLTAEGPIASATWSTPGKVTYAPSSGHTDDSFSVEDWHGDTEQSELAIGAKVSEVGVAVGEDGNVDFTMSMIGKDFASEAVRGVGEDERYFTSPAAETSTPICHSSCGTIIIVSEGEILYATGFSLSVKGNPAGQPAVGSRAYVGINPGKIIVDGQLSAYFPNAALRDLFRNETPVSIIGIFAGSDESAADFVGFTLPRAIINSADKDDGDKTTVRTYTFTSEWYAAGGSGNSQQQTSLYIQDSQA